MLSYTKTKRQPGNPVGETISKNSSSSICFQWSSLYTIDISSKATFIIEIAQDILGVVMPGIATPPA